MDPFAQAAQQTQQQNISADPQQALEATNQALLKKQQQQEQQATDQYNMAAISQATAMLNPNGHDIQTRIGKAIQTPGYAYSGLCLKWVDDQQGNQDRQPTAYADYIVHAKEGNINTSTDNIPKGARVYFAPDSSNGGAGHIGIANGNNTFTSATDSGIEKFSLQDWEKYTGQKFLGWSK